MVARIKKNDIVLVIAGKDKGKQGSVIEILHKKNKVLIKDVAMIVRHQKARRSGETPGIKKRESYINLSKAMPVCKNCKKPCRVQVKVLDDARSSRVCNRCKEIF